MKNFLKIFSFEENLKNTHHILLYKINNFLSLYVVFIIW